MRTPVRPAAPVLLGALGLSLIAPPALAGPVRMTNSTTAQYRLHTFTDEARRGEEVPYGLLLDRLNLVAAADGFSSAVRVDGMLFVDPPQLADADGEFRDDARVERFSAGYGLALGDGDLKLTVGDFYRQLGRGILLSLRKEDEIGVDISLRGGQAQWLGDMIDVAGFVGRTNPINLDNVSEKFVEDPGDIVAGGEVKIRDLGPMQVGLHSVYLDVQTLPVGRDGWILGAGGSVEIPDLADIGSLYVEADWQRSSRIIDVGSRSETDETDGLAVYGVAELYFDPFGLVVEGLLLDCLDAEADGLHRVRCIGLDGSENTALQSPFNYNQPPTLERIDQEVLNSRDVLGGRARLDYAAFDGDATIYANGMLRLTDRESAGEVTQMHVYGGVDLYYAEGSSRLSASGGWRDERKTGLAAEEKLKTMAHAEGDLLHAFDGWSLAVGTINEYRTLFSDGEKANLRGSTLVGVEFGHDAGWMQSFADQLALTFELGYDDDDGKPGSRSLYYAGIVDWTLDSRLRVRALAGTQRGGLKCVGGVCRIYPEFAGARLDLITTLDL